MTAHGRSLLGRRGEDLAARELGRRGFEVVARNARVGRLEIDLIGRRGDLLVICEVRSRSSDRWMSPAETVNHRKQAHVRQAAARWLREQRPGTTRVRFDVVSIVFDGPGGSPRLTYYEAAF